MGYYSTTEIGIFLIIILISLCSSAYVKFMMSKYSKERCGSGMTGEECAREILNRNGIGYLPVESLSSEGGDHYSSATSSIALSPSNFNGMSITALSVAAHECGHAVQHNENYPALILRQAMVPVTNWGSKLSWVLIFMGLIYNYNEVFVNLGILTFSVVVLFSIITLPVEFNASHRALVMLSEYGITTEEENAKCRKVLIAAALTYVASTAVAVLQILRLFLRYGGKSRSRRK